MNIFGDPNLFIHYNKNVKKIVFTYIEYIYLPTYLKITGAIWYLAGVTKNSKQNMNQYFLNFMSVCLSKTTKTAVNEKFNCVAVRIGQHNMV